MEPYIEKTSFVGEDGIKAGNDMLEFLIIPGWGSNLISLRHKSLDLELLRVPKTKDDYLKAPILFGTPILFPPNRIADGRFTFGERTYHFEVNEKDKHNHIHGLVHGEQWVLRKAEVDKSRVLVETEFDSASHPHLEKQFPHHFMIRMSFVLEDATLTKTATIINRGEASFPWGLGYHTTFRFPLHPEATWRDCTFALSAEKKWELNERLLPTGELLDLENRDALNQGIHLLGWTLDDVFLSGQDNQAVIRDRKSGLEITYRCDENFKHWVVYNGDGTKGFVCPEPYTWVTNAPNLKLPPSLTGLQVLHPGEQKSISSEITVST